MPETVDSMRDDLANYEAQLEDVRTLVTRLSEDATAATLDGDEDRAEDLERKKMRAEARMVTLRQAVKRLRQRVRDAEKDATEEAAARRVSELATLISARLDNEDTARAATTTRLPKAVELARDALEAEDEVRRLRLEIRLLCRLFDVDAPDVADFDAEARDELLGVVASAASDLGAMARSYPLDATSGSHGQVLRRKLPGLARGELAGRHLLTDATRELWADAHGVDREDGE